MKLSRSEFASAGLLATKVMLAAVGVPPAGLVELILVRIWFAQACSSESTSLELETSCDMVEVGAHALTGKIASPSRATEPLLERNCVIADFRSLQRVGQLAGHAGWSVWPQRDGSPAPTLQLGSLGLTA